MALNNFEIFLKFRKNHALITSKDNSTLDILFYSRNLFDDLDAEEEIIESMSSDVPEYTEESTVDIEFDMELSDLKGILEEREMKEVKDMYEDLLNPDISPEEAVKSKILTEVHGAIKDLKFAHCNSRTAKL